MRCASEYRSELSAASTALCPSPDSIACNRDHEAAGECKSRSCSAASLQTTASPVYDLRSALYLMLLLRAVHHRRESPPRTRRSATWISA